MEFVGFMRSYTRLLRVPSLITAEIVLLLT